MIETKDLEKLGYIQILHKSDIEIWYNESTRVLVAFTEQELKSHIDENLILNGNMRWTEFMQRVTMHLLYVLDENDSTMCPHPITESFRSGEVWLKVEDIQPGFERLLFQHDKEVIPA